ncbi:MAG: hypothetical protein K0R49_845 [Burkholderiales bacterium]|jgi:hypothetical protein|nr:hypothetical protein [Burkholderiales bacterium]
MKKFIMNVMAIGLISGISACATQIDPTMKPPGFLPNYSLLKPVSPSPDGTQIYTYTAPNAKHSDYRGAIIESVALYQNAVESGITAQQIEEARKNIDNGISKIIRKKIAITNKAESGVVRVSTAITGATLEKEGFKPWNIIPVSAAIKLASMATGLDSKKPVLVVEIKITDSMNGKMLKEIVSVIDGEKFHMSSNTAAEFQKLAVEWVAQAVKYSVK